MPDAKTPFRYPLGGVFFYAIENQDFLCKLLKISGGGKWKEVENRGNDGNERTPPGEMVKKPENPGTGLSAMPRGVVAFFYKNFPAS